MVATDFEPAFTPTDVLAMERAAARAWPAVATVDVEGWLWRGSGGGSRRANSVLPLAFGDGDCEAAIDAIEALYRKHKLRCYFQVSSIAQPPDLDSLLERRGYVFEEPVLLLAKHLAITKGTEASPEVAITSEPTPAWLEVYLATVDAARQAAVPATLARVPAQRAFFVVRRNGEPVATALCVVSPDAIAIVECVATVTARRRSGAAGDIMTALEAWAAAAGATTIALQVVESNTPARALYAQRDYRRAGRYHYRWRDV
jgi:N-acetylglutamate synthase